MLKKFLQTSGIIASLTLIAMSPAGAHTTTGYDWVEWGEDGDSIVTGQSGSRGAEPAVMDQADDVGNAMEICVGPLVGEVGRTQEKNSVEFEMGPGEYVGLVLLDGWVGQDALTQRGRDVEEARVERQWTDLDTASANRWDEDTISTLTYEAGSGEFNTASAHTPPRNNDRDDGSVGSGVKSQDIRDLLNALLARRKSDMDIPTENRIVGDSLNPVTNECEDVDMGSPTKTKKKKTKVSETQPKPGKAKKTASTTKPSRREFVRNRILVRGGILAKVLCGFLGF